MAEIAVISFIAALDLNLFDFPRMIFDGVLEAGGKPDEILLLARICSGQEEIGVAIIIRGTEQPLLAGNHGASADIRPTGILKLAAQRMPLAMPAFHVAELDLLGRAIAFEDVSAAEGNLRDHSFSLDRPIGLAREDIQHQSTLLIATGRRLCLSRDLASQRHKPCN